MSPRAGSELPYKIVASTVPTRDGWLQVSAKIKGATFAPEFPRVIERLYDVFNHRPAFAILAIDAPIGDPERALRGERSCDLEASQLLGVNVAHLRWPETSESTDTASEQPPGRETFIPERCRELVSEMAPFLQRTICEVLPELSFYQLNGERALSFPATSPEGYLERRDLLAKVPGVSRILDYTTGGVTRLQLLDAAAMLWSARRIAARAGRRAPTSPEWDEQGLRVEYLR